MVRAGHEYTIQEVVTGSGESAVTLHVQDDSYRLPSGPLPVQSVAAAVMALRSLEPEMDQAAIEAALVRVKAPGRFERLGRKPDLYVDVGHNPHAAKWLSARLQALKSKGQKVHAVYAALEDKDVEGVAHAMASAVDHWFLAGLDVDRGLGSETLRARLESAPLGQASTHDSVVDAIAAAKAGAVTEDIIIVFGSFFTVAEARRLLL